MADLFEIIPVDVIKYLYQHFDTVTKIKAQSVCKFFKNLTPVLSLWRDYHYRMTKLDIKTMLNNVEIHQIILSINDKNYGIKYYDNTIHTDMKSYNISKSIEIYSYMLMHYPKSIITVHIYRTILTLYDKVLLPLWKKSPKISYKQVIKNISFVRDVFISEMPGIYEKIINYSIDELQFLILTTGMTSN